MSNKIIGNSSGNIMEVNASNQALVITGLDAAGHPEQIGGVRVFNENDAGNITGAAELISSEVDQDYRQKTSNDTLLDSETFNYAAQNTAKHTYGNATMTTTWTTGGLLTNASAITTTGTGITVGTYAEFPVYGAHSLYCEFECAFNMQPVANNIIDVGMFRRGASAAYTPSDGAYFRLTSAGIQGVINSNTSEIASSVFPFTYTNSKKYQFIITISQRVCEFWIDNILYARINTPVGLGQPFMSSTLPFSLRQAFVGTAGGAIQMNLSNYNILVGGSVYAETYGQRQNAILGSYEGLSGQTMGQLVSGTITSGTLVKPTAAVPSNTALTANLGSSLGGRSWETYTSPLATNTDGVICAYQVPAGTVSIPGKRLKVTGVKLSGSIQTVMTGGPFTQEWYLIFGGTAISLQTAEGAAAKPCRRIMLPEFTQVITAAQAVQTMVSQPGGCIAMFPEPIYVNPGEWIGLANNWFGTAPTAGVIAYTYQFIYSWE